MSRPTSQPQTILPLLPIPSGYTSGTPWTLLHISDNQLKLLDSISGPDLSAHVVPDITTLKLLPLLPTLLGYISRTPWTLLHN